MTCFFADSIWLSPIFGDALCNTSSTFRLWTLDQAYAYCELVGRHQVGSEQSKLPVEAENRKPLKTMVPC